LLTVVATALVLTEGVAAQATSAATPPWWTRFQSTCLPVLRAAAVEGWAIVAMATMAILVLWLVYLWVSLIRHRLPAVCASVQIDGKSLDGKAIWEDTRGRIERVLNNGFAAIHDSGAAKSSAVEGVLLIEWQEAASPAVTQRLAMKVDDKPSRLRAWFGGRNIIRELTLSVDARRLRIDAQPTLALTWTRPALPPDLDSGRTTVTFFYLVDATYTVAGDPVEKHFRQSLSSPDESIRVDFPNTIVPDTIPSWSVETTAGLSTRSVAGTGWKRTTP
jgi:hypothetical protein